MKKLIFLSLSVCCLFACQKASLAEQYADKVCNCTNPKTKEIKEFSAQAPSNGDTLTAAKKLFKMGEEMMACTAELDKQVAALNPTEKTKFDQELKAITDKKCPLEQPKSN